MSLPILACNLQMFCTEIAVEKHFDPLKCDFWGPQKLKNVFSFRGLCPLTPYQGLCPQTPIRHAQGSSPPKRDTLASPLHQDAGKLLQNDPH